MKLRSSENIFPSFSATCALVHNSSMRFPFSLLVRKKRRHLVNVVQVFVRKTPIDGLQGGGHEKDEVTYINLHHFLAKFLLEGRRDIQNSNPIHASLSLVYQKRDLSIVIIKTV